MLLESEAACTHCAKHEEEDTKTTMTERYIIAGFSTVIWVVAILIELLWQNQLIVYTLSIAAILMAGRWIIPRGLRGAAKIHLDINFLMTFAAFAALIIGAPLEGAAAIGAHSVFMITGMGSLLISRTRLSLGWMPQSSDMAMTASASPAIFKCRNPWQSPG